MIQFAAVSNPGNRYQHNEDTVGWDEANGVWLIADGMGGHARGDLAAKIVRQTTLAAVAEVAVPEPAPLRELIMTAHDAVLAQAVERNLHNMGSTVVMARVQGAIAEIGWCGDSRAYLYRDGELLRLTADHSLLEQLLRSGVVQPDEAFTHPQKHVLIQALGIEDPRPKPSEIQVELISGDRLLLCSDGIHDELRDEQIATILRASHSPQVCVEMLQRQVLKGTARDNLSALCLDAAELVNNPAAETFAELQQRLAPPRPVLKPHSEPGLKPAVAVGSKTQQPVTGNNEFDRNVARRRANVKAAIAAKGLTGASAGAAAADSPLRELLDAAENTSGNVPNDTKVQPALDKVSPKAAPAVAPVTTPSVTAKQNLPLEGGLQAQSNRPAETTFAITQEITQEITKENLVQKSAETVAQGRPQDSGTIHDAAADTSAARVGPTKSPDPEVSPDNSLQDSAEDGSAAQDRQDTDNPAVAAAALPRPSFWARDGIWSFFLLIAIGGLLASYFPWLLFK